VEVAESARGPELILSRSHPNLVRRLFEREVPEIFKGSVEICAISREAGGRTKVAVASRQEGVDPVGSCVGLRGLRIQNIVNELQGERIDVIQWDSDISVLLANALRPAKVIQVELSENDHLATVVVPDDHFSLAIGKEGQNVRLAAKLTGLRIDLKGESELASAKVAEEELGVSENDEPQDSIESIEDQDNSKTLDLEDEIDNEIAVTVEGLEAVVQKPIETTAATPLANEVNDFGISAEEALLAQEDEEDSPHNENFNDGEQGNAGSPSMDDEKVWAISGIHREPSVLRFREDIMPQRTPDGRDDKGKGRSKRSRRSRTNEPETASG